MGENVTQSETMLDAPGPLCSEAVADPTSTEPESAGQRVGASEEGHWYLPDGTPFYTYVNKKGETKPVTLRQARPVNAYPSVTTIMKVADRPAINNYFERHIFDATLRWLRENPVWAEMVSNVDFSVLDLDTIFENVKTTSREHRDARSERGTALHAEIERFLRGDLVEDKSWLPHIANLVRTTAQYGINLRNGEPEHSFAHTLGFGGKADHSKRPGGHDLDDDCDYTGMVIDFKTKDTIEPGKRYAYDEHAMQIAAYREGLGISNARCLNVFVGAEDCKILIHEWDASDLSRGWQMFRLLLPYWKLKHKYWPKPHD